MKTTRTDIPPLASHIGGLVVKVAAVIFLAYVILSALSSPDHKPKQFTTGPPPKGEYQTTPAPETASSEPLVKKRRGMTHKIFVGMRLKFAKRGLVNEFDAWYREKIDPEVERCRELAGLSGEEGILFKDKKTQYTYWDCYFPRKEAIENSAKELSEQDLEKYIGNLPAVSDWREAVSDKELNLSEKLTYLNMRLAGKELEAAVSRFYAQEYECSDNKRCVSEISRKWAEQLDRLYAADLGY